MRAKAIVKAKMAKLTRTHGLNKIILIQNPHKILAQDLKSVHQ